MGKAVRHGAGRGADADEGRHPLQLGVTCFVEHVADANRTRGFQSEVCRKPRNAAAEHAGHGIQFSPPLARFARVVQKSAAANAPTAVKRTRFSRSQKGCAANSLGGATTGADVTTSMEPALAGRARPPEKVVASSGTLGRGSIEARLTAACAGSREESGDKGARKSSCANSDPEHVSKSARSSSGHRKARRKTYVGI